MNGNNDFENGFSMDVSHLENIVLAAIKREGRRGATSAELSEKLQIERVSISPRLRPLANKSLIGDSGGRRSGTSNRGSIVWVALTPHRPAKKTKSC